MYFSLSKYIQELVFLPVKVTHEVAMLINTGDHFQKLIQPVVRNFP